MIDGVINVVDNHAKALSDKLDITVFTLRPCGKRQDTIAHPYKVVRCKSMPVFFLDYDLPLPSLDRKFKKALKESKLDLVYFHSPMTVAKAGIKYAKKHNIPIVSHMHSQFKKDYYRATRSKLLTKLLLRGTMKVFNQSDCAVAVNEFTEELFVKEYGLKAPTRVIYNATDMLPIKDEEKAKKEINEKFNLSENEKVFCYVGRINKLKNIDMIIDSVLKLKEKSLNFKLLLVGDGGDREYFENKVKKLDLQDKVIFAGRISDKDILKSIYLRSDLFVFPSEYDTDGLVRYEAASQGTPSVVLEGTGAASGIKDFETGFVSKNDVTAFADKILEAIEDEDRYKVVCKNVRTKFYRTWQDSADEVYKLIEELTNKYGGRK